MSGHNKWSSIKHRKGAQDAKRGKVFTKIIREIVVAVKESGKDPDTNSKLKTVLAKARDANMPKDTVNNAIKRGAGEIQGESYDEINYEGYGPAGVAVLVETLTDNRNRTASDIRHLFSKYGGNLGENGCVGWLFDRKGIISIPAEGIEEDKVMEIVLEAGAEDIVQDGSDFVVTTDPTSFNSVREALEAAELSVSAADLTMIPQNTVKLEGKEAERMLKLMDALEDNDDVQTVSANFEIDEAVIEQFMGG